MILLTREIGSEASLESKARMSDVIARMAADEFTIVLENLSSAGDAARVADKIIKEIDSPFTILDLTVRVSASTGISLYPQDGDTPDLLLRRADEAMYRVKKSGKNNFGFYSSWLSPTTIPVINRDQ